MKRQTPESFFSGDWICCRKIVGPLGRNVSFFQRRFPQNLGSEGCNLQLWVAACCDLSCDFNDNLKKTVNLYVLVVTQHFLQTRRTFQEIPFLFFVSSFRLVDWRCYWRWWWKWLGLVPKRCSHFRRSFVESSLFVQQLPGLACAGAVLEHENRDLAGSEALANWRDFFPKACWFSQIAMKWDTNHRESQRKIGGRLVGRYRNSQLIMAHFDFETDDDQWIHVGPLKNGSMSISLGK